MGAQVFIEPVDVWLFRDGRPFTGGEDIRARSLFPPSPLTLQGAIRSKILLSLSGVDLADENAVREKAEELGIGWDVADFGRFRLKGPIVAKKDKKGKVERLLPAPADLLTMEGGGLSLAAPKELPAEISVNPLPAEDMLTLWAGSFEPVEPAEGWLSEGSFKRYLRGEIERVEVLKPDEVMVEERRTGIALSKRSKTAEEGMLYQAEFVRLKEGVGLWAEVEGAELPEKGEFLLGGEGKAARFERIEPPLSELDAELRREVLEGGQGRFKVVLLTPAFFVNGWRPEGGWEEFFGPGVSLRAVALPRPVFIGGHGFAGGEREARPFVRPGAVYFFEGRPQRLPEGFTESPPGWDEIWKIGFGLYTIGRW